MPRLHLRVYTDPGEVQIFANLLRKDGNQETLTTTVDTGAAISLFPVELLDVVVYRPSTTAVIVIDQAGIASQTFEAYEGFVTLFLEDTFGNLTEPFEIPAWFATTKTPLLGFAGLLDRAVLHIDMPQREGWLEINP